MTMKEMQARIEMLRELYTDVRLLDADTVGKIQENVRVEPFGEELCYASRHKKRMTSRCAAKMALATRSRARLHPPERHPHPLRRR